MKSDKSQWKHIWILLFTAVLVRGSYLLFSLSNGLSAEIATTKQPDSLTYIAPADAILQTGQYLNGTGQFETERPPGYPLFLYTCMILTGSHWVWAAVVIQYFLSIISCLGLYKTVQLFFSDERIPFGISLAAALNIHDVSFCNYLLSDTLSQTIGIFTVFLFFRFLRNHKLLDFITAIFLATLNAFVRPSGLFLPFLLIGGMAIVFLTEKRFRKSIPLLISVTLITVIPILSWCFRNQAVSGYFGFSSSSVDTLYYVSTAGIVAHNKGIDYYSAIEYQRNSPELAELAQTMSEYEAKSLISKQLIQNNLPYFIGLYFRGMMLQLLFPGVLDIFRLEPNFCVFIDAARGSYVTNGFSAAFIRFVLENPAGWIVGFDFFLLIGFFVLTILGFISLCKTAEKWYVKTALFGFFFYYLILHAIPVGFGGYSRYRLALSLIQLLVISFFLNSRFEAIKKKKK